MLRILLFHQVDDVSNRADVEENVVFKLNGALAEEVNRRPGSRKVKVADYIVSEVHSEVLVQQISLEEVPEEVEFEVGAPFVLQVDVLVGELVVEDVVLNLCFRLNQQQV